MLKIGVAGAGSMGANHCKILNRMKDVDFVGLFDIDSEKAEQVASQCGGVIAFSSFSALLEAVDAVIIAVSTSDHFPLTVQSMRKGKHVLIEKPFVVSLKEAAALIKLREQFPVIVQIGHVERFNPVFVQLSRIIKEQNIVSLEARRCGHPSRLMNTDVILDMMIHDLDLILHMIKSPIVSVTANGRTLKPKGQLEIASALIGFENGVFATLVANRLSQERDRMICITETDRLIKANLLKHELFVYPTRSAGQAYPYSIEYAQHKLPVPFAEPLFEEIRHFVHAIEAGHQPQVSLLEAEQSLKAALKIKQCIQHVRGNQ